MRLKRKVPIALQTKTARQAFTAAGFDRNGASRTSRARRVNRYTDSGPEWRNWQTQETQNLPPVTRRVGSIPSSGTMFPIVYGESVGCVGG